MSTLPIGYIFDQYEIIRVLGVGGFGVTYLAVDSQLDKEFALKEYFPKSEVARDKDGISIISHSGSHGSSFQDGLYSFLKEAKALAGFNHPNIVSVHRFLEGHGTAYILMDYLTGDDLVTVIERGYFKNEEDVLDIFLPLLDGLEKIHGNGLLHRDIKPENIILHDGTAVLIDFGAARKDMGERSGDMSQVLTPGYAPIEQYGMDGKSQGAWGDVYAVGATIYTCITGKQPASSTDRVASDEDSLDKLSDFSRKGYSKGFLNAVDWALELRASARPQSVSEWREVLVGKKKKSSTEERSSSNKRNKHGLSLMFKRFLWIMGLAVAVTPFFIWDYDKKSSQHVAALERREAVAEKAAEQERREAAALERREAAEQERRAGDG